MKTVTKKKTRGRPRKKGRSGSSKKIVSIYTTEDHIKAIDNCVDELNKSKGKYTPPITRNSFIRAALSFAVDHVDKIVKY
mgnify:FL=1